MLKNSPSIQDLPAMKCSSIRPRCCWQLAAGETEGDLSIKVRLLGGRNTTSCVDFAPSRTDVVKRLPFRHALRACHLPRWGRLIVNAAW